jgi:hypothetical protein
MLWQSVSTATVTCINTVTMAFPLSVVCWEQANTQATVGVAWNAKASSYTPTRIRLVATLLAAMVSTESLARLCFADFVPRFANGAAESVFTTARRSTADGRSIFDGASLLAAIGADLAAEAAALARGGDQEVAASRARSLLRPFGVSTVYFMLKLVGDTLLAGLVQGTGRDIVMPAVVPPERAGKFQDRALNTRPFTFDSIVPNFKGGPTLAASSVSACRVCTTRFTSV